MTPEAFLKTHGTWAQTVATSTNQRTELWRTGDGMARLQIAGHPMSGIRLATFAPVRRPKESA